MHTHRLVRTGSLISLLAALMVGLAAFFVFASSVSATVLPPTTIYVDASAAPAGEDGSAAHPFTTISSGVAAAAPGDTVLITNGLYTLTSTLNINKPIKLSGESEAGVVIDASGVAGYGIAPSGATGLVLENFTLTGPAANTSGRYGIKAYDLTDFTIRNVTVRGSGRSEVDLNRVNGASLLEDVTAQGQGSPGVGIALSNSSGVTLRNIGTSGNAWGSVGLYDTASGPTSNIVFDGTYTYDETVYTIYIDTEYHKGVTNLTLPDGFDWAVTNDKFRTRAGDFVLFQQSLSAALDAARAIQMAPYTPNAASVIQAVAADGSLGNTFVVGSGMSLSAANNRVAAGGTINLAPGQYDVQKDDMTVISGQTGWYLPITKNGVTIQGVKADGTAITNANDVEASIYSTQYTPNGAWASQNLITVFADDVTIRGVWVMTKVEPNKGIEILGNNFTADAVKFSPIPASVYPGITNIGGYDYSTYGSGPYFNNNGATTARTGAVTNSLFVRSGISFDSFGSNWTVNISGNTFDGNRVIGAGATNYYYSAVGATTWASQPNFTGSTIAIHDNTFQNFASDQVILKLKSGMTGTLSAERNYWGGQTGPAASNLVSDLLSQIVTKPWYIDSGKTTLSNLADITAFSITGPIAVNGTITGTNIDVVVPNGTDVSALTASVTTNSSNATPVSPASETVQNFSSPVAYTVTAVDGTTKVYTVTVKQAQTITVDTRAPGTSTYGSSFSVAAHSNSALGVVITTSGGCTGGGTNTTTINVTSGSTACVVKYNQAGNASFAAATEVTETSLTQKATLTVTGITAADRLYNGGTGATLDTTGAVLNGAVNGDAITLDVSHAVGTFADKHKGSNKTVNISGVTTDADTDNYTLVQPTAKARIIANPIEITAQPATKTYDGTTASTVAPIVTDGSVQGGDTASFTQTFDTKHFGISKILTPAGIVNDGNGGNNYTYTFVTSDDGEITRKLITVQASMDTKVYDGTDVSIVAPGIIGGLGTGDTAAFTQKFDNATVGNSKNIIPSGSVSDGNSGLNYTVTFTPGAVGTITAAPLTVTAKNATKTYGDTLSYTGTEFTTSGLKGTDSVTTAMLSSTGSGELVSVGDYDINVTSAGGTGLSNYDITYVKGTLTVNKKPLSVTAHDASKVAGTADPAFSYSNGALIGGDTITGSLTRDAGEDVGTYSITNVTVTAGGNYAMTFTQGTFSILPDTTKTSMTLATTTSGVEVQGTIPGDTTKTSAGTTITIPAGTTVTGTTTWDGVMTYPETTTSYTGPTNPSGYTTSVTLAVEVGDDAPLTFSKGVRLVFAGKAGQRVGWSRDGVFTEITSTCSADSQTAGDALAAAGDCKIDSGSDLVVWTKHFTTFLTYTQTQNQTNTGGNGPVAGGGGGGGAAPVALPNNGGAASSGTGSTGGQVLGVEVYNFATDLRVGSRGADVTELQKVLIAEGFLAADSATGYFGALTKAAVIKYQAAHGISPQSGLVGPLTRAALNGRTATTDTERATLIQTLLDQVKALQAKLDALRN